jgi:hypothetical protein
MDLDELKDQLRNKLATDHAGMSDEDLSALLTRKTVSVVGRLKRSLKLEIVCCIGVTIGFSAIGIFSGYSSLRIYFSVFAVLCALFLVLLVYLLRRTTRLSAGSLPVRGNLQTIVTITEEFMKRYFQFTMALVPVCFVFSLLLGVGEKYPINGADRFALKHFAAQWKLITFLLVYVLVLGVGVFYFTKWYVKKQFGRYVAQLKECIRELGD